MSDELKEGDLVRETAAFSGGTYHTVIKIFASGKIGVTGTAKLFSPTELEKIKIITRYAITHLNEHGDRVLSFPNQGRNHFDTPEEAQKRIAAVLNNNTIDLLISIYGDGGVKSLEVRPVKCYENGDVYGYFADEEDRK